MRLDVDRAFRENGEAERKDGRIRFIENARAREREGSAVGVKNLVPREGREKLFLFARDLGRKFLVDSYRRLRQIDGKRKRKLELDARV